MLPVGSLQTLFPFVILRTFGSCTLLVDALRSEPGGLPFGSPGSSSTPSAHSAGFLYTAESAYSDQPSSRLHCRLPTPDACCHGSGPRDSADVWRLLPRSHWCHRGFAPRDAWPFPAPVA